MDILESILSRPVKLVTISSTEAKVTPITKQWTPPPLFRTPPVVDKKKLKEKELKEKKEKQEEEEKKRKELRAKLIAANRSGASGDVIWKSIKEEQKISLGTTAEVVIPQQHNGFFMRQKLFPCKSRGYQFKMPVGKNAQTTTPKNNIEESFKKPNLIKQVKEQPKRRYICGIPQPIRCKPEDATRNVQNNTGTPVLSRDAQAPVVAPIKGAAESTSAKALNGLRNKVCNSAPVKSYYDDWDKPNQEDLDFIDDDPLEEDAWRRELRSITGYNPSKFKGTLEECDVSGFERSNMEERYSTIIGNKEDAEQLKLIELEEKREQMMKQLKRRRH